MKRVVLSAVAILTLSFASFAGKFVAEGISNSALGKYRIEMDDNVITLNGKTHLPFIITYENSGLRLRVAVDMDSKCKKYYVISDDLSIQYVSTRNLFGVEFLDKDLAKDGYMTTNDKLDRKAFFHQKVLTRGSQNILENTKLIACFYPLLLNNEKDITANR